MTFTEQILNTIERRYQTGLLVSTKTEQTEAHGQQVEAIHVYYRSGNESLPLADLLDDLRKLGKASLEYHGRGAERGTPRLVFEIAAADGQCVQIHWHLGDI